MSIRLLSLVFLALLLKLGFLVGLSQQFDATQFNFKEPTDDKFFQILNDKVKSTILIAHRRECAGKCLTELSLIADNLERFKMMDPDLEVIKFDVRTCYDAQNQLILDTDHGVYYLHRGESVRVDTNDMGPEDARNLILDLQTIVQRRVALIETYEDVRNLNHTNRILHMYYGKLDDVNFTEIEIASKLTDRDIYRIEHPGIAKLFKLEDFGMYTYIKEENDAIRMRGSLTRGHVLKFLLASSRPVPQDFDQVKVLTSIHQNIPVLLVYARTESTNTTLKNILFNTEYLTKAYFHVYQMTDPQNTEEKQFFDECNTGQNWGFLLCILRSRRGIITRYVYDKKIITFDRVQEFLQAYTAKKLEPFFRSEEIEIPLSGRVQNLNLKSFRDLMETHKPETPHYMVIYYYNDGCQMCEEFAPTFEAIANEYRNKKLSFARINLSKNEALEVRHLRIPSLHYTTGYDDEHVKVYKGDWARANVTSWIEDSEVQHLEAARLRLEEENEPDL